MLLHEIAKAIRHSGFIVLAYQIFSGLSCIHSIGICHCDIKPENILCDPETLKLQLCDFGLATSFGIHEQRSSYVCTRNYCGPESLYGSTQSGFEIDIWAAGCVLAEALRHGQTLFPGESGFDVSVTIAQYIGLPNKSELGEYGANVKELVVKGEKCGIATAFSNPVHPKLLDLLTRIFVYSPWKRLTAEQCLEHPYFKPIRLGRLQLP
jgi:glycogen synthase kinase 3 beta